MWKVCASKLMSSKAAIVSGGRGSRATPDYKFSRRSKYPMPCHREFPEDNGIWERGIGYVRIQRDSVSRYVIKEGCCVSNVGITLLKKKVRHGHRSAFDAKESETSTKGWAWR